MNFDIRTIYTWEIQTEDGQIFKQYDENGNEKSWKDIDVEKIVRASMIPSIQMLPKHDLIIDISKGEKFVRRFARGFQKCDPISGYGLKEYINCIVTNKYRLWVFTNGNCIVTGQDQEIYI